MDRYSRVSRRKFVKATAAITGLVLVGQTAVSAANSDTLIDSLDLSFNGLEQVRAAAESSDSTAARTALASYFRNRQSPKWYIQPGQKLDILTDADRGAADSALRHRFVSVSIAHTFDGPINWRFNPTTQPSSPDAADHEWTWQLNRHDAWVALARTFGATGDEKYGRELATQMRDWLAQNPVPTGKVQQGPGSPWRTIECGIRMGGAWMEIFWRMVKAKEVFPDDVLLAMVDCMRQHAEYLNKYPTGGNWLTMEANGEYHVGVLFPEFKDAEKWRTTAIGRLRHEIDAQVYPDGAQMELTPGYHNVALKNFVWAMQISKKNDLALPDGYLEGLEKMYELNMKILTPDRDIPPLNDSWHLDMSVVLKQGSEFYPNHPEWRWIVSAGKEGAAPAFRSLMIPYAGWAVMRTGWETDALYMHVDTGPFGKGHQHEDKLSIILYAYGSRLIFDAGSYAYDASEMRHYVTSARGHNVIHVDGMEQIRRHSRETFATKEPVPTKWRSTPEYDYVEASYGIQPGELWGKELKSGISHTRRILFVKGSYWVVVDTLTPTDAANHKYESTFHIDSPEVTVDEQSKTVKTKKASGANLAIVPLADENLSLKIITGQEKPFVQGWLPKQHGVTGAFPRPTAYYTREGSGPVQFLYVFAPSRAGQASPVTSVQAAPDNDAVIASEIGLEKTTHRFALLKTGSVLLDRGTNDPAIKIEL